MQKERIWILLARKLSYEATIEELTELEEFLKNNPEMHFITEAVQEVWNAKPKKIINDFDAEHLFNHIKRSSRP